MDVADKTKKIFWSVHKCLLKYLIKKTAIKLQIKRIRNIQQRYSLFGFNGKQEKMKIHANFWNFIRRKG